MIKTKHRAQGSCGVAVDLQPIFVVICKSQIFLKRLNSSCSLTTKSVHELRPFVKRARSIQEKLEKNRIFSFSFSKIFVPYVDTTGSSRMKILHLFLTNVFTASSTLVFGFISGNKCFTEGSLIQG